MQIFLIKCLKLLYFWFYDCSAISLGWVLIIIILMVLLGWIKLGCLRQLCYYIVLVMFLNFLDHFFSSLTLLLSFVHYDWSILSSFIMTLSIQSSGIVKIHKYIQQVIIGNNFVVIVHSNNLGMSCSSFAYSLVCRVWNFSSCVTTLNFLNSF